MQNYNLDENINANESKQYKSFLKKLLSGLKVLIKNITIKFHFYEKENSKNE